MFEACKNRFVWNYSFCCLKFYFFLVASNQGKDFPAY